MTVPAFPDTVPVTFPVRFPLNVVAVAVPEKEGLENIVALLSLVTLLRFIAVFNVAAFTPNVKYPTSVIVGLVTVGNTSVLVMLIPSAPVNINVVTDGPDADNDLKLYAPVALSYDRNCIAAAAPLVDPA